MKRDPLLRLLLAYSPSAAEELACKQEMLDFLQKEKNCFERSLKTGHFTASSWLINKANTKVLLMHHAKLDIWCQLGGHCDGETNVLSVALKEAKEESGIQTILPLSKDIYDIDIHLIPANHKDEAHKHYDIRFLLQTTGDEEVVANHESKALVWFDKGEKNLPTKERSILRMHEKWLKNHY